NRFSGGGDSPDGLDLKALKVAMFGLRGHFPDVFWDGYANGERAEGPQICVQGASGVVNADAPNKFKNPTSDAKPFDCKLEPLAAVELKRGRALRWQARSNAVIPAKAGTQRLPCFHLTCSGQEEHEVAGFPLSRE